MLGVANFIVVAFGVWLFGVSAFALVKPRAAIDLIGKFASTNLINYSELALRALVGAAFIVSAETKTYTNVFLVVGWFMLISAFVLMAVPRRWHARYAVFWAKRLPVAAVYIAAPVTLFAGAFLIF